MGKLSKCASVILPLIASTGVAATAVAAAVATPKALKDIQTNKRLKHRIDDSYEYTKKDAFLAAWKHYIPATMLGASTIACIMGGNILSRRQQATLASAYALVQNSYSEYKRKLKDIYGEEAHNAIVDSIMKDECKNVHISTPGGWYNSSLDFGEGTEPETIHTFYDSFSKRYFESTVDKVIQAEYHLNRNYLLSGAILLNDFYEFLGLPKTDMGDILGWSSVDDDIYWIDFNHRRATLDDGMEVFVIDMIFEPSADLEDSI
jgi:hypothetical protein